MQASINVIQKVVTIVVSESVRQLGAARLAAEDGVGQVNCHKEHGKRCGNNAWLMGGVGEGCVCVRCDRVGK